MAAVWAATKGTKALITGLSLAFGQDETLGFIRLNLTAFLFTLGAIIFGVIAVAAVIVFPIVMSFLHLSRLREVLVTWLRWPVLVVVVQFGLAVAYHYGPARPPQKWRWITPGSVVATALWIAGSALFFWFASLTATSDRLDGSLGVVITILTWFLLSAYVVILGAELDTEIERQRTRAAPDVDGAEKAIGKVRRIAPSAARGAVGQRRRYSTASPAKGGVNERGPEAGTVSVLVEATARVTGLNHSWV